jgi:hypothetical protein
MIYKRLITLYKGQMLFTDLGRIAHNELDFACYNLQLQVLYAIARYNMQKLTHCVQFYLYHAIADPTAHTKSICMTSL